MAKRKALSKKVRFEVFKRDEFACQYCGGTPPKSILHVDHIIPVAGGGGNEEENLITSCSDCNLGKGARLLDVIPESLSDKASRVKEREAQIAGYAEIMNAKKDRENDDAWTVSDLYIDNFGKDGIRKDWFQSIKRFNRELGVHDVAENMEYALCRFGHNQSRSFSYFCGICWRKIKEAGE